MEPLLLRTNNPGPLTGDGNNTYLLIGDAGTAALIDAGQGEAAHLATLCDALTRRGATLGPVLVTHAHADHASGARALHDAHPDATFHKWPWPAEDARFPVPWQPMRHGDRLSVDGEWLVAIHTPGHSPDHLSVWHEASRTAFVGDLVVAIGSVAIHASRGGDLVEYLASLEHLRALAPARLLPAHGAPIDDPEIVLTRSIAHRLAREEQVLQRLTRGGATVEGIVESIYDGLRPALLPAAHDTVRAHLEKLRREGRASADGSRWFPR